MMIMYGEVDTVQKEAVVCYLNALFRHPLGGIKENR
jgi:hypothetical protein